MLLAPSPSIPITVNGHDGNQEAYECIVTRLAERLDKAGDG
jgi:hypothetical protein